MKINEQLGMRISYLRKQRGLSQLDLACEANINRNYLCDLEKGKRNPTVEVLLRLCIALNITLEELFKGIVPIY